MIIWLVTLIMLLRHYLANYNIININVTVFLFDCHSWSHSSWHFPGTHTVRFSCFPPFFFFSLLDLKSYTLLLKKVFFFFLLSVRRGFLLKLAKYKSIIWCFSYSFWVPNPVIQGRVPRAFVFHSFSCDLLQVKIHLNY